VITLSLIMATAADVRSILSLPGTPGPSQPKKPATQSTRKPEGISRELYSLIGPSAPSLAAQLAKPRLKQKPNLGGGGKVKWCVLFAIFEYQVLTWYQGVAFF
jgi:DNA methyltransferase 1-associated protein 1